MRELLSRDEALESRSTRGMLTLVVSVVCLLPLPVSAQDAPPAFGATAGQPYTSEVGPDPIYGWLSPPVANQLELDPTPVPADRGAIFVPTVSDSVDEPEVLVFRGDERVATGPTGRRIVVAPGSYTVRVGSGAINQTSAIVVTVETGATEVVPVVWGGLVVEVVDTDNIPFRGDYELIRVSDREVFGVGFGADTLQGERLQTWLLPPGLYRLVRPGASFRARRDFASVYVPSSSLVLYKLVLDPDTGDFRGAGVITRDEMSRPSGPSPWTTQLVLGLNLGLSHVRGVAGTDDELVLSGDVTIDTLLGFDDGTNAFFAILEIEEGAEGEPTPFLKATDRVRLDLLYTHYLTWFIGPYVRFRGIAELFPSEETAGEAGTVRYVNLDGSTNDIAVGVEETFRVGDWLPSLQMREGAGVNLRLLRSQAANANLRLGLGLRQSLFNGLYVVNDDPDTDELEYEEVADFNQEGIETVLTGDLRLAGFITYTTDLDFFAEFDAFDDPSLDWRNTLSLRFASFVSLDYNVNLVLEPRVTDDLQVTQEVLLRLSWEL